MPSLIIKPNVDTKTLTSSWTIAHTGTGTGHPVDTYYVSSGASVASGAFVFDLSVLPEDISVTSAYIDYSFSSGYFSSKANALIGAQPYRVNANTTHAPYTDLVKSALYGTLTVPISFSAVPRYGEESSSSSFYGGLGSHSTQATWSNVSLTVEYALNVSKGTPPTLTVSPSSNAPGKNVTLSWSGAVAGASNAITGYMIRQTNITIEGEGPSFANYRLVASTATSGTAEVPVSETLGEVMYYDVVVVGEAGEAYYSDPSNYVAVDSYVSMCGQPTVSAETLDPPTGRTVAIAVSGASDGINNPVVGYRFTLTGQGYTSTVLKEGTAQGGVFDIELPDINDLTLTIAVSAVGENDRPGLPQDTPNSVTVTTTPTAPTPPTELTISSDEAGVRVGVTLSWSGAQDGAGNKLVGYDIMVSDTENGAYTLYKTVNSVAESTTVQASDVADRTLYFRVVAKGSYGINSAPSTVFVQLTSTSTACTSPTRVVPSTSIAYPGAIVRLAWDGAMDGGFAITGYQVYGDSEENGAYADLIGEVETAEGNGELFLTADRSVGSKLYLKVKTLCELPEYDSALSEAFAKIETVSMADASIGSGKTNAVLKVLNE